MYYIHFQYGPALSEFVVPNSRMSGDNKKYAVQKTQLNARDVIA